MVLGLHPWTANISDPQYLAAKRAIKTGGPYRYSDSPVCSRTHCLFTQGELIKQQNQSKESLVKGALFGCLLWHSPGIPTIVTSHWRGQEPSNYLVPEAGC